MCLSFLFYLLSSTNLTDHHYVIGHKQVVSPESNVSQYLDPLWVTQVPGIFGDALRILMSVETGR